MRTGRNCWLLAVILLAGTVSPLWGGTSAKIDCTVQDANRVGVPGVHVTVTSPGLNRFHKETESNKKGRFTILVVDATQEYLFHFEKEGYPTFDRMIQPLTGTNREIFYFPSSGGGGAAQPAAAATATGGMGKAGRAFNAGADALAIGDTETAKTKFTEAAEADPTLVQAPLALAKVYAMDKNHEASATAAERTLELAPDNVEALVLRYDACKALGDEARTRQALDGLLTVPGGRRDVAARVFNAGVEADITGDPDTARTIFERLIETNPDLAPAHAALSIVLETQQDHAGALAAADRALELDPKNISALKVRYEAYKTLGDQAMADEAWDALAASDPAGVVKELFSRGGKLFNANRLEEAMAAYESALKIDPDHAKSHYMLGLCLVNSGKKAMAKEHLSRFLELTPDDPDAGNAEATLDYLG